MGLYQRAVILSSTSKPKGLFHKSQEYLSDKEMENSLFETSAVISLIDSASSQNMQTVLIHLSLPPFLKVLNISQPNKDRGTLKNEAVEIFKSFLTEKDHIFLLPSERILMILCRRRMPTTELVFHQWRTVFNSLLSSDIDFNTIAQTFFCPKDPGGIQQAEEWIKKFD